MEEDDDCGGTVKNALKTLEDTQKAASLSSAASPSWEAAAEDTAALLTSTGVIANVDLTPHERWIKHQQKQWLKQQTKRRKYQVRLDQARRRKDDALLQRTLQDLAALDASLSQVAHQGPNNAVKEESNCTNHNGAYGSNSVKCEDFSETTAKDEKVATLNATTASSPTPNTQFILNDAVHTSSCTTTTTTDWIFLLPDNHPVHQHISRLYFHLQRQAFPNMSQATMQDHHAHARHLLHHMTKGTQQLDMFDNAAALGGYARQKFVSRAVGIAQCCFRLERACTMHVALHQQHAINLPLCQALWHRLQKVTRVASVGCGPGCDVVGFLCYHYYYQQQQQPATPLDHVLLLDWALPQWQCLLNPLQALLTHGIPNDERNLNYNVALAAHVSMAVCNITVPLNDAENAHALQLLTGCEDKDDSLSSISTVVDLYLLSYILSETRGKWSEFMASLIKSAPSGTLFLVTDPTAWQSQVFVQEFSHTLSYAWLDSSMYRPELQSLDNRVGCAALLAMKE
jgi:hypothetical protein